MKAKIYPSIASKTAIRLPSSKSLSHRAIIAAAIADGTSHITNIDYSVDIEATIEAMKHLGARIEKHPHALTIEGTSGFRYDKEVIDARESGSTLRFLIPLFTLCNDTISFTGSKRLFQRPLNVYEELFEKQGLTLKYTDNGITTGGKLKSGDIEIKGNISSQFITGLLLTLPLVDGDSTIRITPPFESRSYVDLTLEILDTFGINAYYLDEYTIAVKGNQHYQATDYEVETDYSQLAFFASLGLINNDIECMNLNSDSKQGDRVFIDIAEKMNGIIQRNVKSCLFKKSTLKGAEIDLSDCPDLGPMCFALASMADGESVFTGALRLRIKESDRIAAMECELRKLNQQIESDEGTVIVKGKRPLIALDTLDSHNDHRIVMALSILATVSENEVIIDHAEAINKSYPCFFEDLRKCNIRVELYD